MNLHKTVAGMVSAQNNFDSRAYADFFSETAVVYDEGKTHNGKAEIELWIETSNREYQARMQPVKYEENEIEHLLTAEVSGQFPGSPAVLQFHIRM